MDFGALIQQLGFPVATAVYFIWRDYQKSRDHLADIKGIAQQAVTALNQDAEVIEKNTTALDRNSVVLQRMEVGRNANNNPTAN